MEYNNTLLLFGISGYALPFNYDYKKESAFFFSVTYICDIYTMAIV